MVKEVLGFVLLFFCGSIGPNLFSLGAFFGEVLEGLFTNKTVFAAL